MPPKRKPTEAKAGGKKKKKAQGPPAKKTAEKGTKTKTCSVDSCYSGSGTVHCDFDCMLKQTNIALNINKFYLMQLIQSGNSYTLWTRWGRVGEQGTNQKNSFSDVSQAIKAFEKKFQEKTRNKWAERTNFCPVAGKYTLVQAEESDEDGEDEDEDEEEDLGNEVQGKRKTYTMDSYYSDFGTIFSPFVVMNSTTDNFAKLPIELQQTILQYLTAQDLCSLALCNRSWREVANQDAFWGPLCRRRGWQRFGTTEEICKKQPFVPASPNDASPNIAFPMDVVIAGSDWPELIDTCKWKEVYMKASHLEANWENNRYHTVSFEFGAAGCLETWMDVAPSERLDPNKTADLRVYSLDGEGDCLAVGLSSGTLKIWDMSSGICHHVIKVPVSDDIHSVKMKNGTVAVGCTDGRIRTFSSETGERLKVVWGHNWKVTHVFIDDEIIVSAVYHDPVFDDYDDEEDEDNDDGNRGDEDGVDDGDDDDDDDDQNAKPGTKESDIRVFGSAGDVSNFLLRYRSGNAPLVFTDYRNKIVAAAYKVKVICVWDAQNGTQLHTIKTGMNRLVSCHLGNGYVIGTNDKNDPVMKQWDLSSGKLRERFDFPEVRLLDKEDGFMVNRVVTYNFDPEERFLLAGSRLGVVGSFGLDGRYFGDTLTFKLEDPQDILKLLLTCVRGNKIVVGDFCDARMFLLIFSKAGGFKLVKEIRSMMFDEMDDDFCNRAWVGTTKLAFPSYFLDKEELKNEIQIPKIIIHHYW